MCKEVYGSSLVCLFFVMYFDTPHFGACWSMGGRGPAMMVLVGGWAGGGGGRAVVLVDDEDQHPVGRKQCWIQYYLCKRKEGGC